MKNTNQTNKKAVHAHTSAHARKRMQQRAISDVQIKLIEAFGDFKYQKGGSYYAFVPTDAIKELRRAIDKLSKVRAIYSDTDQIVTVMHETRNVRYTGH